MKKLQGFASMSTEERREIARSGGLRVSLNREYMREIGRKGGIVSGERRRLKIKNTLLT